MTKNCEKGRETRGRRAAGCRAPGPGARKPGDRRRGDGSLPRRRSPVQRAGLRVVRRPAQPGPGRPGGRLERLVSLTRSRRHADAVSATARHSDFQVLGVALTFPSASGPPASQRHLPPARPVRSPCALPVSPREVSPFLDGAPRTRQSSGQQPPVLGTPFLPSSGGGSRGGSRPQRTCRHPWGLAALRSLAPTWDLRNQMPAGPADGLRDY